MLPDHDGAGPLFAGPRGMRWWICLLGLWGCGLPLEPVGGNEAPLVVLACPVEDRPDQATLLAAGGFHRLGPLHEWSCRLSPPTVLPFSLELRAEGFRPVRRQWIEAPPPSLVPLPLVPHRPISDGAYADALDLLQELIRRWAGSRIRRWSFSPLRVSLPAGAWNLDYAGLCETAADLWNDGLARELFDVVPAGAEAEILCDVAEEDLLAYTQLLDRDAEGHPLRMRIHLSPRWTDGAERYVRRAWMHELGHALGLWGHSEDPDHLLCGRVLIVHEPHPDEWRVARWLWDLPYDFDLAWLGREESPGTPPPPRGSVIGCSASRADGTRASHRE